MQQNNATLNVMNNNLQQNLQQNLIVNNDPEIIQRALNAEATAGAAVMHSQHVQQQAASHVANIEQQAAQVVTQVQQQAAQHVSGLTAAAESQIAQAQQATIHARQEALQAQQQAVGACASAASATAELQTVSTQLHRETIRANVAEERTKRMEQELAELKLLVQQQLAAGKPVSSQNGTDHELKSGTDFSSPSSAPRATTKTQHYRIDSADEADVSSLERHPGTPTRTLGFSPAEKSERVKKIGASLSPIKQSPDDRTTKLEENVKKLDASVAALARMLEKGIPTFPIPPEPGGPSRSSAGPTSGVSDPATPRRQRRRRRGDDSSSDILLTPETKGLLARRKKRKRRKPTTMTTTSLRKPKLRRDGVPDLPVNFVGATITQRTSVHCGRRQRRCSKSIVAPHHHLPTPMLIHRREQGRRSLHRSPPLLCITSRSTLSFLLVKPKKT